MPYTIFVVGLFRVMAPPELLPSWLLFILHVVTMAPELEMPVKPPVVAEVVFPWIILLLIFNTPGTEVLAMAVMAAEVAPVPSEQFRIVLLLIFMVAVASAVSPVLFIPNIAPVVGEFDNVIVLLFIVVVTVPVGCPAGAVAE